MAGGARKITSADWFVGLAAILVVTFVIMVGGKNTSASSSDGGGATAKASTAAALASTASTTAAPFAGAETDAPDAANIASREAETDQDGDNAQRANIQEADGQKFSIGEAMHGRRKGGGGGMEHMIVSENSTADLLADQAKKVRGDVPSASEHNVADQLNSQVSKVKRAVGEQAVGERVVGGERATGITGIESTGFDSRFDAAGVPAHARVKTGATDDPFDVFSEPGAAAQTMPNIDFTGFGHMKYRGVNSTGPGQNAGGAMGPVPDNGRKYYPRSNQVFVYKKAPLPPNMATVKYSLNQSRPTPFSHVVEQNARIQSARDRHGYSKDLMTPLETKARNRNQDFLPGDEPDFFKGQGGAWGKWGARSQRRENAIGNELGETGHSFTGGNNVKSGLGQDKQPAGISTGSMSGGSGGGGAAGAGAGGGAHGPAMGMTNGSIGGAIGQDQWEKKDADWNKIKTKVRASVLRILKLFDRFFQEELFPEAVVDVQDDGSIYVRDGKEGMCISLPRFYEYVGSSVNATLGLGKAATLPWGKDIDLNFEAIEKNRAPLRAALADQCEPSSGYNVSADGSMRAKDGKKVQVVTMWPQDQTVLYTHPMKFSSV